MFSLFNHLREEKICLAYLGSFDDEITSKLTEISEDYLVNSDQLGKIKNKVSFLIAESFQNVVRHGISRTAEKSSFINHKDFFQINAFKDRIVLSSANIIAKEETDALGMNIEKINSLNGDELRDLYNDVLENKKFSKKGGAGLGLIEMARKSGLPIKYHFNSLNESHRQFFLTLEIINKSENTEAKVDIKSIVDFYTILFQRNCLMLYKGDMSRDVLLPLVEILKANFMADGIFSKEERITIETLIEIIKNVTKYGKVIDDTRPGIFIINEVNGSFIIECGNFVEHDKLDSFKANLDAIKKMDLEEIKSNYLQNVKDNYNKLPGERLGLGLMEVARNCSNNFSYDFIETEENEVFFSFRISLEN